MRAVLRSRGLGLLLAGFLSVEGLPALEIRLRDAQSGAWISGHLELWEDRPEAKGVYELGPDGVRIPRLPGSFWLRALAPGFRPLQVRFQLGASEVEPLEGITLVLDPEQVDGLRELAQPGECVLTGVVLGEEDGRGLAGVWVEAGGEGVETDSEGRFLLRLPGREAQPGAVTTVALEARTPGRRPLLLEGIPQVPGTHRFEVVLPEGAALLELKDRHRQTSGQIQEVLQGPEAVSGGTLGNRTVDATVLGPPASIRVGFANSSCQSSCCGTSGSPCNFACVFSLETYVARGLNDEWIASWNAHSLRAGAVAYRSYGAYHVEHPRSSNYDICSSACCQVNDPDTSAATNAAAQVTAGVLLERNGAVFRSEYSAENNSWDDPSDGLPCSNTDLSCGDGFVGSPAASWPCLADAVAAGHGCFGHGRGMSQWGTKRWGDSPNSKSWKWMSDHYYNASGAPSGLRSAYLASPIDLQLLATCGHSLAPGGRLGLWAQGANLGSTVLENLLFGASLKQGSTWISDPPGDAPFAGPAGSFQVGRAFELSSSAASGSYDLVGAFWLDVDQNGAITSTDLQLDLLTLPASVLVAANGALFAGCFESGDLTGWSAVSP